MGLFRPYERTAKSDRKRTATVPEAPKEASKKSSSEPVKAQGAETATVERTKVRRRGEKKAPTPTRREAEAARMERLHPNLSPKEQRKAARQARYRAQQEAWDSVEKSPERQLVRDFVDARWTVVEFLMPMMILVMAVMLVAMNNLQLTLYVGMALYGLMFLGIINIIFMWRSFKKLLVERIPGARTKGLLWYMINRAMMIRRFRRPAPRIERGADF